VTLQDLKARPAVVMKIRPNAHTHHGLRPITLLIDENVPAGKFVPVTAKEERRG
jgi:hypothetical protein